MSACDVRNHAQMQRNVAFFTVCDFDRDALAVLLAGVLFLHILNFFVNI
jgi:hypothetical protein